MPIYEYECSKCDCIHEFIQKFSDPPKKKCPECGSKLNKVMSMNAFQLKGEGWYVTDYKGKNASNAPKNESAEKPAKKADSEPKAKKAEKSDS